MKALILAAGFGSRLSPITDKIPKSLVPVNGKPILFKQIENLYENNIYDITIISGYMASTLSKQTLAKYPNVKIIESLNYATTNNMYSAFLAQESFMNEEFIMMNADVYFDSSVISALLKYPHENAIVTDIGSYAEESMKIIEKDNRIVKISKEISKNDALGCSIDVYKFSKAGGKAFFSKCSEYINDKKIYNKWSEVALDDILQFVTFKACPLIGRWYEIDNHDDLHNAEVLFRD